MTTSLLLFVEFNVETMSYCEKDNKKTTTMDTLLTAMPMQQLCIKYKFMNIVDVKYVINKNPDKIYPFQG